MHFTICLDTDPLRDWRTEKTSVLTQNGLKPFLKRERLKVVRLAGKVSLLLGTLRVRTHAKTCGERDKGAPVPSASPESPPILSDRISTYSELQAHVHIALRSQHPEWVEPNGESSICDAYEARLAELLQRLTPSTRL